MAAGVAASALTFLCTDAARASWARVDVGRPSRAPCSACINALLADLPMPAICVQRMRAGRATTPSDLPRGTGLSVPSHFSPALLLALRHTRCGMRGYFHARHPLGVPHVGSLDRTGLLGGPLTPSAYDSGRSLAPRVTRVAEEWCSQPPLSPLIPQAQPLLCGRKDFFDCWWALFGNRAAENNDEGHSVY